MKKVNLLFPDVDRLTDFVLAQKVSGLDVKSKDLLISGVLNDQLVQVAVTKHGAELVKMGMKQP